MKRLFVLAAMMAGLALFWLLLPVPEAESARHAEEAAARPAGSFTILASRVFTGRALLAPGLVEVRDGRIARVGEGLAPDPALPLLRFDDHTLLPGLIDAHVHVMGEGLDEALAFGVTTVLDQANDAAWVDALRARGRGAEVFTAGLPATAPGGHGTQFGFRPPAVRGPEDAETFVTRWQDSGADWIKLIIEFGHGGWRVPGLDQATVEALVAAAGAAGAMTVAHASEQRTARWAIEAGVAGLVHVFADAPVDPALAAAMAARGQFVVPTLAVLESMANGGGAALAEDARVAPFLTAAQRASLAQRFPGSVGSEVLRRRVLANILALHRAGVPVLAGSDAPNPGTAQGLSLHRELQLLVEAGLTPAEALAAATALPAAHFRLDDRGELAPGRRADLLLVEGDPLTDIGASLSIAAIWQRGEPVVRAPAAPESAAAAQAPAHGRLSDFRPDALAAGFGAGWRPTDDGMAGGQSRVAVQPGSDAGGAFARVSGEVREGFAWPWAGIMAFTGETPMAPADLSRFATLRFRARGDMGELTVMLFSPALGPVPASLSVPLASEWQELGVRLADFPGADAAAVQGFAFVAGPAPGAFAFDLADVRLD
jgi:imidazolonepropionase-like amidohydrolase